MIDVRLGLPRIIHRAGRLEKPRRTELRSSGGIATKMVMNGAAYGAQFARTGSCSGKERGLTPWACGIRGRWHFPISSKPFSREVAVYERAAPSGSNLQLEVGLSPRISMGGIERSTCLDGHQNSLHRGGRWGSNGRHASEADLPEARRKRLRYRMSFIIV